MSTTIMLVPLTSDTALEAVAENLVNAINASGYVSAKFLPGMGSSEMENLLLAGCSDDLVAEVIALREEQQNNKDILLINGLPLQENNFYASDLNYKLAVALDAQIILVLADNLLATRDELMRQCQIMAQPYLKNRSHAILGYIVNNIRSGNDVPENNVDKYKNFFNIKPGFAPSLLGWLPRMAGQKVDADVCATKLDVTWAKHVVAQHQAVRLTPALFRYRLMMAARQAQKRIVLPEGNEPRTLQAANMCVQRGLAKCILLGDQAAIAQTAQQLGIVLHDDIEIVEPKKAMVNYVNELYELRRSKGLTLEGAQEQLQDNVMLGTMMLYKGEVDGLVSGAIHTTANTIRPAFQVIKTVPGTKIISSIFFMCLPEQVLIYGDCAVNVNPTAEDLADIALQSAASARHFGITPYVALLSYSTGTSGFGPDVDKVKMAVEIIKQRQPDLAVDGPLQYDAAIDPTVAALKAPTSPVAGKANVFIFPDLDSANIAYKAVQRATDIVCMGPMLQGMRKPVNDLSRGCLVEDIVFTIALTAVQAA